MTTINNANDSKHLYFLYGIVAYGLFYSLWGCTLPVFMTMERLLHPTAVLIGKSIAELALFCFLFRKPKLIDIKWIPFIGIIILPTMISILVLQAEIHLFPDIPTSAEQLVKHHVSKPVMDNLRFWTGIIIWFGIMVFVWEKYRSENRDPNARESNGNSRGFYGGILFSITFSLILSIASDVAKSLWTVFPQQLLLWEIIFNTLFLLLTSGAVFLLVKKHHVVWPFALILLLAAISYGSSHFLDIVFARQNPPDDPSFYMKPHILIDILCNYLFLLLAFILYRKEMRRQQETPCEADATNGISTEA